MAQLAAPGGRLAERESPGAIKEKAEKGFFCEMAQHVAPGGRLDEGESPGAVKKSSEAEPGA